MQGHELLLLDEGHCLREQALDFCNRSGLDESGEFRATSLETLKQMVATKLGLTLVPALATSHDQEGLKYVRFRSPAPKRRIGLVWRRGATHQEFFLELAVQIRSQIIK